MQATQKPDNIPLPNLSTPEKVLSSVILIVGTLTFALTWLYVLERVYGSDAARATTEALGIELGVLFATDRMGYFTLLLLHFGGMLLLFAGSYRLFKKTSLRRRAKKSLYGVAIILGALDVSAWLYAPSCSSTNMYVGVIGVLSAIPLIVLSAIPFLQMWVYRRWKSEDGKSKRIVIVGGGFAGLYAALGLNKKLGYHRHLEIVLIDRKNYFLFPPLLPSASVGTIETRQVSYPFRRIFETTNISFRRMEVTAIDPEKQVVHGQVEENEDPNTDEIEVRGVDYRYDYLVFAPGSTMQTFNTKGALEHCFFMNQLNDAVILRNHIIDCFERAAVLKEYEEQRELLSFVIVGGGPTGIETATEIHDLIHEVLLKRYPEVEPATPMVHILQSPKQILPGWHEDIVRITEKQLRKMQINVRLGNRVTEIGARSVTLGEGEKILARTIVWCAGVKPAPIVTRSGLPVEKSGRIPVNADLSVEGFPTVFVLGDVAHLIDEKNGKPLPPLGQVAFQQGSHTAANLVRLLSGKSTKPFQYFDFGGLVSVGEHFAAVNLLGIRISGFIGWFIWRTLYLSKIVGVSNKIRIVIDWTLDLLIERSISQIRDSAPHQNRAMAPHVEKIQVA